MIKEILRSVYHQVPLRWRLPRLYWDMYKLCGNIETWSMQEIQEWQLGRLREIVNYAYNNVPGYNQLYREKGVSPSDLHHLSDIKVLPVVTKELIRDNINDFISREFDTDKLIRVSTSGSTGLPFGFYVRKEDMIREYAFVAYEWGKAGWILKEKGISLRGGYDGYEDNLSKMASASNFYLPNHSYMLTPYYLDDAHYSRYISIIQDVKADYLFAFPSYAAMLSKLIIAHDDIGKVHFKQILLSSENIYDWQMESIKKAFPDAILHSLYGHTEWSIMGSWKPGTESYEINPLYGILELNQQETKPQENNIFGEMVGTSLWQKVTPFIRYRTNDYATMDSKLSGKQIVLSKIDGRLNEVIVAKNGRMISMTSMATIHNDTFKDVAQFRFIQDEPGKAVLQLVPRAGKSIVESEVASAVKQKLGEDFNIDIRLVNEIKASKSGKMSFLQQNIKIDNTDRLNY